MKLAVKYFSVFLLFLVGVFLFEGATSVVRAFNMQLDVIVMFVKYFLLSLLVFHFITAYAKTYILASFIVFLFLIGLIVFRVDDYKIAKLGDIFFSLPNLVAGALGVLSCYLLKFSKRKRLSAIFTGFSLISCLLFYFKNDLYYDFIETTYLYAKNSINEQEDLYTLTDIQNDTIRLNKDKYVVLDFWHSRCLFCFEKFPEFEQMYLRFKDNPMLDFYSVNQPISNENGKTFDHTAKYSFPTLRGTENVSEVFDVRGYPTVIIVKDNNVVHRGSIRTATSFIEDLDK